MASCDFLNDLLRHHTRHLSTIAVRGSENRVGVRTVSIEPTGSNK
jgi:hypothetical protein